MRSPVESPFPRDPSDDGRGAAGRAAPDPVRARRAAKEGGRASDPVAELPAIPLTPIPVTGRTGPRPGY